MEDLYVLSVVQMFALFFLVLGPMRLMKLFVLNTESLSEVKVRALAMHSISCAAVALTICGFAGKLFLETWRIPIPVFVITAGVIFSLSAFGIILGIKEKALEDGVNEITGSLVATSMIITPFGIATLVILLSMSKDIYRIAEIFAALYAVLLIDFLTMYFVRKIRKRSGESALQIPSVVLGVMQAALAFNLIYVGLKVLLTPVAQ
jgi:small neutral amino acid transporter SnatA (MarC family)